MSRFCAVKFFFSKGLSFITSAGVMPSMPSIGLILKACKALPSLVPKVIPMPSQSSTNFSACIITNIDGSADVALTLQIVSTTGADITDTGVDANESDNAATTSSVTLTVDGSAATTDQFLNERVYKSDGTFHYITASVWPLDARKNFSSCPREIAYNTGYSG